MVVLKSCLKEGVTEFETMAPEFEMIRPEFQIEERYIFFQLIFEE
jgi:hypothetical protein